MKLYTEISHLIKTFAGQANTLTIPAPHIGYTRSLECALLLSQCIYWSDRTKDPDGWFYKTYDEWKEEIYLPEYKVRKYSRQLQEKGVLEIKVKKVNGTPTLHFRINPEKFSESFLEFLQNGDSKASRMETAKFKESKLENLQFQKLENLQFLSLSTKPTTEPTLIKSADEKENLASLRSEPEQLHLKTPVTDQAQEISQGHSRDLVLDQSSAPANFPQKKNFTVDSGSMIA